MGLWFKRFALCGLATCLFTLQVFLVAACGSVEAPAPPPENVWRKGNLHSHSFWSDGDDFPEMVIGWYHSRDYDFVALSEHNGLAEGERFIEAPAERVEAYRERFGDDWVELRDGEVRLKTLEEYRTLFEEPDRFLIVPSEEISDEFETKPIHLNATNIKERIEPQGGTSVLDVMQNNVDAVLAQRERTGQKMFPHINHPNFGWAVKVEDLIALEGERFFEVYNGHPLVHNEGDEMRPSTERMWDILLTERLANGSPVMYGIAVDDAHNYHDLDSEHSNPGRGWVMVRAAALTPEALIDALERGDFYGSSGVTLAEIVVDPEGLALEIEPEAGITYRTQFIGTRMGYDTTKEEVDLEDGATSYRYSTDIGAVLAEVAGAHPSYVFEGDEVYVRAKVTSSKLKENPYKEGELESAWVQPVVPPR